MAGPLVLDDAPELVSGANGQMLLARPEANRLLRDLIEAGSPESQPASIPIAATEAGPAAILHLIPVRGEAHDLFGGGLIAVLTRIGSGAHVPDTAMLHGLFDLTPSEARLAASLATGLTLKEAAEAGQLQVSTARSYLENVLRKTGTRQQSQLVALLKGSRFSR